MRKNKKKEKEKWEKGKAISQRGYGVDTQKSGMWSVEELLLDYGQQWRNEWLGWIGFTRSIDSMN